jgi:O-antigen/teichoic acid export membrane protein
MSVFQNIKIGVFLTSVNLITQFVAFLAQNYIAKNLGVSNFGYFGLLQNDYLIFSALADFGMTTLILAFFANRAVKGKLFVNTLQLRFSLNILASLLMLSFAFLIRKHHPIFRGELILAIGIIFQHSFFDWFFICGQYWKRLLIQKIFHAISYTIIMAYSLIYLKLNSVESIALAMLIAGLPSWLYAFRYIYTPKIFLISKRSFRFFFLMIQAATPYALASLASFAFLPAGLYIIDYFSSPNILSAYNYANKIVLLASGLMVHFISSNIISLHKNKEDFIRIKDILIFSSFILLVSCPLWLFPKQVLQLLFFASSWTKESLEISSLFLRFLSISLLFQAMRVSLISKLLKEKRIWSYVSMIGFAGVLNILIVYSGTYFFGVQYTPILVLTGDLSLSLLLIFYYKRRQLFHW